MQVNLSKKAKKYLDKTSGKNYDKLIKALIGLEELKGDINYMESRGEFRLKTPPYRILFIIDDDQINVLAIGPRGDIYKKG